MTRGWWIARTVAAVLAALGLGACASSTSSQTSRSSAAPTTTDAGPTTTTTTTVTTSTGATSPTTTAATANAAGAPTCVTSALRLTLASAGGAAGTAFLYYDLTNVGVAACSMVGYPGVSIVDAHGHIVQHPATRGTALTIPVRLLTIKPRRRVRFLVNSTDVIPSPGCSRPYRGTTLQVYPPNQRTAILLPDTGSFCDLRVGPVQPAS